MLSLRGPLCAGEAFELEAAGPRGLFSGKGCCAKKGARAIRAVPAINRLGPSTALCAYESFLWPSKAFWYSQWAP